MMDDHEALAAEIAEAERIGYDQARDAAALELPGLRAYAQAWNAERAAQWRALRAYARRWDLRAAIARARRGRS